MLKLTDTLPQLLREQPFAVGRGSTEGSEHLHYQRQRDYFGSVLLFFLFQADPKKKKKKKLSNQINKQRRRKRINSPLHSTLFQTVPFFMLHGQKLFYHFFFQLIHDILKKNITFHPGNDVGLNKVDGKWVVCEGQGETRSYSIFLARLNEIKERNKIKEAGPGITLKDKFFLVPVQEEVIKAQVLSLGGQITEKIHQKVIVLIDPVAFSAKKLGDDIDLIIRSKVWRSLCLLHFSYFLGVLGLFFFSFLFS